MSLPFFFFFLSEISPQPELEHDVFSKHLSKYRGQLNRIQRRTIKVTRALKTEMKRLGEMKSRLSGLNRRCLEESSDNSLQIYKWLLQRGQQK